VIVAIGSDHAGYDLKETLKSRLAPLGHAFFDVGARDTSPSDYPDFARALAQALLASRAERGLLICGSGVGASVAANKVPGIRAAVCHDTYSAHQGVEHDDMNVLVLGARIIGIELAAELAQAFLQAKFSGAERHVRRLDKIVAIERAARAGEFDAPATWR
jgi:RpiB/LacA/LacB family sugar-phosphate isomerase